MLPFRALLGFACALLTAGENVEVVLARCKEDLGWVAEMELSKVTTVYDKCGVRDGPGRHIATPNLGRESGTYLQHIVDRYDSLAEWTVFSQAERPTYGYRGHRLGGGHMMPHVRFEDYVQAAASRAQHPRFFVFSSVVLMKGDKLYQAVRHGYGSEYSPDPDMPLQQATCGLLDEWTQWYPFPEWFAHMVATLQQEQHAPFVGFKWADIQKAFDVQPAPVLFFAQGARFALSKDAIQSRPKEYYQQLLSYATQHVDPWAGYLLEWLWWYVVGGSPAPCGFESRIVLVHLAWEETTKGRGMVQQGVTVSGTGDDSSIDYSGYVDPTSDNIQPPGGNGDVTLSKGAGLLINQATTVSSNNNSDSMFRAKPNSTLVLKNDLTVNTQTVMTGNTVDLKGGNLYLNGNSKLTGVTFKGKGTVYLNDVLIVNSTRRKFVVQATSQKVFQISRSNPSNIQTAKSADFRRTDLTNYVVIYFCGSSVANTFNLLSGNALQLDLACQVFSQPSYSNYIGTLTASSGSLVQFLSITPSSRPTYIKSIPNLSQMRLEAIANNTASAFTTQLLVYDNPGTCSTNLQVASIDGCASGYTCSTSSGVASNSSMCALNFTQAVATSSSGGSNNDGLLGLIALVALVPLAALVGLAAWFFLRPPVEAAPAVAYYIPPEYFGAYPAQPYSAYVVDQPGYLDYGSVTKPTATPDFFTPSYPATGANTPAPGYMYSEVLYPM